MTVVTENNFDLIPETALAWHKDGKGAILATVVETWGSAPRRIGGQLVVSGSGEMAGSVSGGCVEAAVVFEAIDALEEGAEKLLEYGVSDGDAFAVGLACGGKIRILLEPVGAVLPVDILEELVQARATRRSAAYCVNVKAGTRGILYTGHEARMRMDRSGFEEDNETFIAVHNPPLRMIVIGAVHIAQTLVPMARLAGFNPIIIDPRESFGSDQRFPNETVVNDWPDEALAVLGDDARTALVLLTHDPKMDDPTLQFALRSEYFYIGVLGSTRTHGQRVARLLKNNFSQEQIDRVNGPIGLNIGSATPAEIAVSILAQVIDSLRRGQ